MRHACSSIFMAEILLWNPGLFSYWLASLNSAAPIQSLIVLLTSDSQKRRRGGAMVISESPMATPSPALPAKRVRTDSRSDVIDATPDARLWLCFSQARGGVQRCPYWVLL